MPEMLPCPLLLNRYSNPNFKTQDDSEAGSQDGSGNNDQDINDDNYLDPERDYELINNLRRFILTSNDQDEDEILVEDAHYSSARS